jgi:ATP-dependent DNA helicase RecQ
VRLLLPPVSRRAAPAAGGRGAEPSRRRAGREAAELDQAAQALFEALRRHRLEVARAEGVAPFIVASDRTLRDIATLRPRNLTELELAHGVGRHKAERYGAGWLRVVAGELARGGRP